MRVDQAERAAKVLAVELAALRPSQRRLFLSQMMAHAAAGLAVVDGPQRAAEAVYQLADEMVERGE